MGGASVVWHSHDPLPKHRTGERVWCQPYTLICTTTTRFLQANEIARNLISANVRAKGTLINWRVNGCCKLGAAVRYALSLGYSLKKEQIDVIVKYAMGYACSAANRIWQEPMLPMLTLCLQQTVL